MFGFAPNPVIISRYPLCCSMALGMYASTSLTTQTLRRLMCMGGGKGVMGSFIRS